jgi:phosphoglycolate phosphatase
VVPGPAALRDAGPAPGLPDQQAQRLCAPAAGAKGLDGYFEHAFGGDAFARKKPDPLPLLETCKRWARRPRAR